jgi:hypothetical protein
MANLPQLATSTAPSTNFLQARGSSHAGKRIEGHVAAAAAGLLPHKGSLATRDSKRGPQNQDPQP